MCGPPRLRGRLHDNNMCTQLGSGKDDQLCSLAVSSYLTSTNGSSLPPPSLSLPSQEVDCHGNGGWNKPWKNSKQRSTESFFSFLLPPLFLHQYSITHPHIVLHTHSWGPTHLHIFSRTSSSSSSSLLLLSPSSSFAPLRRVVLLVLLRVNVCGSAVAMTT